MIGFEDLESAIYEAAVIPERWPQVLARLGDIAEASGAVLFSVNDQGARWTASNSLLPMMKSFIEQGWVTRNSRMNNGFQKRLHLEARFVTEADYYAAGEIEADALNQEFFRPAGLGASAGTLAALPHGDVLCFSVERDYRLGPVEVGGLHRLNALRPHLVRAALLAARLGLERSRGAVETLGHLGFAAAAVTGEAKVLVANREFADSQVHWTTGSRDRIILTDKKAQQLLSNALATLDSADGVRSVPLHRGVDFTRDVLHVVPVRRAAHDIFSRADAILVISSAIDRSGNSAIIDILFDLSPAETAVARRLASGRTIEEIAVETGRAVSTIRNQVKSILAKTGCDRQSDFVRLCATLIPPGV